MAGSMTSLPASHVDLLDRPLPTVLTTEMPDGRLQSTVVWCNRRGGEILLNTMREFQKARNLRARPRATVLVLEPGDASRWIEVRGGVILHDDDAVTHLDELTRRYLGTSPYFGTAVPAELAEVEHPVMCRLIPARVLTGPMRTMGGSRAVPVGPAAPGEATHRGGPAIPATHRGGPAIPATHRGGPAIPATHRDLLERPLPAAMSTRMPDGSAQTQPVWCTPDRDDVLVNTTRERRKGRNLAMDPRATLLVVDPEDSGRWIEIRGDAELIEEGAEEQLDLLTEQYTGKAHYYGAIYPERQRECETRVIVRVHPRRINVDAIHR